MTTCGSARRGDLLCASLPIFGGGLNKNSNGLLRQYFPKGMALTKVRQDLVQYAVGLLNHRPQKVLDFKTPYEVFFGKTVRYTKSTLNFALRN